MNKFLVTVFLFVLNSGVQAEEIKVKKSNLVFAVSAQHIAELAAANLKLYSRYPEETKRWGPVSFQSAYVASVIAQGGQKYIFVGFPLKKPGVTYLTVFQYCDQHYELAIQGLDANEVEVIYKQFIDSNNKSLTQVPDACEAHMGSD